MKRFLFLLICLSSIISTNAQQPEDIPYIQYYSHALNGIVIERADGTDSRIIGQGLVEDNPVWIEGSGWSASGEWFAWRSIDPYIGYAYTKRNGQGYVAHINGETHLDWMNEIGCVEKMWWHPTDNLLLVLSNVEHSICYSFDYPVRTYSLFDLDNQQRIATISLNTIDYSYSNSLPAIEWYEDKLEFIETTLTSSDMTHVLGVTMLFDGNAMTEVIANEPFVEMRLITTGGSDHFFSYILTDTEERPANPPINSSGNGGDVAASFSPDKQWLFIGYEFCVAGCGGLPHHVNIYNPESGHNREIASCGVHFACVNWLPGHVNLDDLPLGRDYPISPLPDSIEHFSTLQNDFGYGWFENVITQEIICDYGQVPGLVRDLETDEIVFILPDRQYCGELENGIIPPTPVMFALSPDEQYYAITDDSEFTALYHADTGHLITRFNFYGIRLSFSADSSELITNGRFAVATWDIQRLIEQYEQP